MRHLKPADDQTERLDRINALVNFWAKCQLDRLSSYLGIPKRCVLEQALEHYEQQVMNSMAMKDHNDYYDLKITQKPGKQEQDNVTA